MDGIYCQWDFFPYSVLIYAKSRLRGFRSRAIHAASTVPTSVRGRHSQRKQNKPSGSAQLAQAEQAKRSAQSAQSKRQRAASTVSAISALQAVARSSTSNTSQAVARNPRSRSGSAQSAQLAQSVQSTRQCPLGSVSAVRAENSALRTFRAIFFERQCVWRGRQCAPINKKPFRGTTRARAPPENNCPFF